MALPNGLMTMPDVLQMFDITIGTLQTWRAQKGFPTIVIPGRARNTIRFEKKAVLKWAKKNGKKVVVENVPCPSSTK